MKRAIFFLSMAAILCVTGVSASAQDQTQSQDGRAAPLLRPQVSNKDEKKRVDPLKGLPPKVLEQYVQESAMVADECKSNSTLSSFFDCDCRGSEFLMRRAEAGPTAQQDTILLGMEKECRDATQAAGEVYTSCLQSAAYMKPGTDPEVLCTCVGSTFAKLIDRDKPKIDQMSQTNYMSNARIICENPDLARSMGTGAPPEQNFTVGK